MKTVNFHPRGTWLASGSYDRTARIWEVETGKVRTFGPYPAAVTSVAYSPDGRTLVLACNDNKLHFLDHETGAGMAPGGPSVSTRLTKTPTELSVMFNHKGNPADRRGVDERDDCMARRRDNRPGAPQG